MSNINQFVRLGAAAACLSLALLSSCGGQGDIVGTWRRVPGGVCGEIYPDKVTFLADSSYVGGLVNWNGGKYQILDRQTIKMDTRSGPALYHCELTGDDLTFTTDWGCEVKYRRKR